MKNRIKINNIWYIREDQAQESIELDPIKFDGIVVENENYCFEATRILKDNGEYYEDGVSIKFTDKRVKPWKEDYWDSNSWMRSILKNNPESIKQLPNIDLKGINFLKAFLQHLTEKEWL